MSDEDTQAESSSELIPLGDTSLDALDSSFMSDDERQDAWDALSARMAELDQLAVEADAEAAKHSRDAARLRVARDQLHDQRESFRAAHTNQHEIMRYLETQQRIREQRGEQIARMRDANIDLKALLPQPPPVDAVRRNRPRQKPGGVVAKTV